MIEAEFVDRTNPKNESSTKEKSNNLRNKIIYLLIYIIFLLIYIYFYTPILNPLFQENYLFISINIIVILGIILGKKIFIPKTNQNKIWSFTIGGLVLLFIILSILSSPIINSNRYHNLIGDIQTINYDEEKPEMSTSMIPVVDLDLAEKLGDKVLGKDVGLGSQYDIGEYYLVSIPNDIVWIAPLEPQNFFKWIQNKNTIPGYIYVSATNPNDVRLVKEINANPLEIKYSNKSYFNHNIHRYTYLKKNYFKGLTDYSFEIDDNGYPYWVITQYKPTIGFSGYDVSGVTTVDAQTGETKNYDINDKNIPKWIERIYPSKFIKQQLDYYGSYARGWFNSVTTQKEMIKTTNGLSYVFIDGIPYYYTGMTSVKSDESTVGFMITNILNKKTIFYKLNGATETAAQNSAQGKVQQYGYEASNPILLDIYNKPSYFMTLKDNDGLVKQYAFVSVENYNIVGIGDTVENAQKDYYNQLKNNNQLKKEEINSSEIKGIIERINYIDNFYYLKLKDNENIFVLDKDLNNELILSQPDDNITINYIEEEIGENKIKNVTKFENNSF